MQIVALVLAVLSTLVACGNVMGVVAAIRRQRRGSTRGYSSVPLLSVLLAGASWLVAETPLALWVFAPAALDPGTWMVPVALVMSLRDRLR